MFLAEETPEFIAKNLVSRLKQYAETLKTPFFGALVDYAEEGNQLWTCPGHNGGIFYSRSPIGRIFVEHLGEAVFRDDLDNSVLELGDLLTHEGPALQAQKEAAAIFGAEKTYFVLNGTSSSNKIVLPAWSPRATSCCSTATTTRPPITARCCWAAASRSISRPTATPTA